jgi:hypothetical protein
MTRQLLPPRGWVARAATPLRRQRPTHPAPPTATRRFAVCRGVPAVPAPQGVPAQQTAAARAAMASRRRPRGRGRGAAAPLGSCPWMLRWSMCCCSRWVAGLGGGGVLLVTAALAGSCPSGAGVACHCGPPSPAACCAADGGPGRHCGPPAGAGGGRGGLHSRGLRPGHAPAPGLAGGWCGLPLVCRPLASAQLLDLLSCHTLCSLPPFPLFSAGSTLLSSCCSCSAAPPLHTHTAPPPARAGPGLLC